ncbi:MAG: zinc ribbon domain-containing protein [Methanobrevibacter sp.]|uniref:zinc ribbon domain-containing protein n=1 Tax=Methanobrevibacter sp. TaxID=66852 RepID=UPI0025F11CA0|nr:PsbP-related protein [Methanobrevibacter sp.]MBR0271048.1 zinc ribbon domain-containing protein [Methanobrevibacter sp.]
MKKCPECGNPSYDGAPVCGNCGYKFPKPKVKAIREEDIFEDRPIINKNGNEPSTLQILKDNKLVIGAILLITIIVIGIIIATGPATETSTSVDGAQKYSNAGVSFTYPSDWSETNGSDELHEDAIFFEGSNGTFIEYYTVSSEFSSIYEINSQRISSAQENGDYINTIQTIQLDGKNTSDVVLENYDGSYTRYVSLLSNGNLYVLKFNGNTLDSVTSNETEAVLQSIHIE